MNIPATGITLPQPLGIGDSPSFTGLTLSGLTASRLVASDGAKAMSSADLASFLSGTADQVIATDNGDGSVTLSTPQSIDTAADVDFATSRTTGLTRCGSFVSDGNASVIGILDIIRISAEPAITLTRSIDADAQWKYRVASNGLLIAQSKTPISGGPTIISYVLDLLGNFIIGGGTVAGSSATKNLVLGTGVAPLSSPADSMAVYSADQAAGNACFHTRSEAGHIIKLFRQANIVDADGTLADLTTKYNTFLAQWQATGLGA